VKRLRALRALRWNYRWRGVLVWLRARHQYEDGCAHWTIASGWWWLLHRPDLVYGEQLAIAEGVTS
jgi:hypothetical protein